MRLSCTYNREAWQKFDVESIIGSTFCSLFIVLMTIYYVISLWEQSKQESEKELLKLNEELKHMAQIDALTKVYNRHYLTEYLEMLIAEPDASFGAALIDIDDFKIINDTYGHVFGDEVLVTLCEIMKSEINNTDIIARYGGEEFIIIFKNSDQKDIEKKLKVIAEKFKSFSMKRKNKKFTFSGGVDFYNKENKIIKIYNKVDKKLYEAKNRGKNMIVWNN